MKYLDLLLLIDSISLESILIIGSFLPRKIKQPKSLVFCFKENRKDKYYFRHLIKG